MAEPAKGEGLCASALLSSRNLAAGGAGSEVISSSFQRVWATVVISLLDPGTYLKKMGLGIFSAPWGSDADSPMTERLLLPHGPSAGAEEEWVFVGESEGAPPAGRRRTYRVAGGSRRWVPGQPVRRRRRRRPRQQQVVGLSTFFSLPPVYRARPRCPVRGARGPAWRPLPAALGRSLIRPYMSLPVVLPGSCCPVAGLSGGQQAGGPGASATVAQEPPLPPLRPRWPRAALQPPLRPRCSATAGVLAAPPALSSRRAAAAAAATPSSAGLPARPLLSLGLLQLILGCCMVALSFGALSLSSSPQVKNACPFWAGSSVILSGIIGLTTWKRPMILLVNLFVLLSVVCVLLNLAGFILGCQGAQFVSSVPRCDLVDLGEGKICFCCEEFQPAKCTDKENALKLFPVQPCSAVHLLLKKVLFALCALNALTTTVCLVAAALRYLQIFAARRSCSDESQISAEEVDEHRHTPDPDDFVPPVPPPSYFATYYSCTPRTNRRYRAMGGPSIIPLPHIYGARIKGVEVFCPLDPPPPYEAVVNQTDRPQASSFQMSGGSEAAPSPMEQDRMTMAQDGDIPNAPGQESASTSTADSNQLHAVESWGPLQPLRTRSKSDPLLHHSVERAAPVLSCEAATQTEGRPDLAAVTLRRGLRSRVSRCRPQSLIDYKSYVDTKVLVAKILEQSSGNMNPDIHELVESIKSVLKCDEEHMEEAIASASVLEQIMAPRQPGPIRARRLPLWRLPGLLHLQSCGDLSTFVSAGRLRGERRPRRAAERPHSLIGVFRETVL